MKSILILLLLFVCSISYGQMTPLGGGGGAVGGSGGGAAPTHLGTINQVTVTDGSGTVTFSTPQDIHSGAAPTFSGVTLSGLANGIVKSTAGLLSSVLGIDLTTDVTGVLPIANGGTNSSGVLANNRMMLSSGGAVVESAVLNNGQIIVGTTLGAPSVATITGTGNQISVANGAGSITLSTPQDIDTNALAEFGQLTIDNYVINNDNISNNGDINLLPAGGNILTMTNAQGTISFLSLFTGNAEIWVDADDAMVRLGSSTGEGDASDKASAGYVLYNQNIDVDAMGNKDYMTSQLINGEVSFLNNDTIDGLNIKVAQFGVPGLSFADNTGVSSLSIARTTGTVTMPLLTASTPLKLDASNQIVSADIDLLLDVTGVLPIANGGTNSSTALNNNRLLFTSAGAIVETAALTNGQIAIGSTGLAPVISALTPVVNQTTIVNGAGSITIGTAQDIAAISTPTFAGLNVDNLNLNGNVISSTDLNGNITLDPNGLGIIILNSDVQVNGTITNVSATTLDVTNITMSVNEGGNQASANSFSSGFIVQMSDATDAGLMYSTACPSFWGAGEIGSEDCIMSATTTSTFSNKTGDFVPGLAALPSLYFDGDNDTGMWHSIANTLNFSSLGAEVLEIDNVSIDSTVPFNAPSIGITGLAANQIVKTDASSVLTTAATISLTTEVAGVLPIANGGTNSSTALTNNKVMLSSGGGIVESGALTNGQIIVGSTGLAPVITTITPTANQTTITNGVGAITVGTVQDIATTSNPTFVGATLSGLTPNQLVKTNGISGLVSAATISLTTEVTGVLPIANGGTNSSAALLNNRMLLTSGGAIVESAAATNGQIMIGSTGLSPTLGVLSGTLNQVNVVNSAGGITLSTPQNIHAGASPTFLGATLSGLTASEFVKTDGTSGLTTVTTIPFTSITGVVPVAQGGTNSSAALTNGKLMHSTGGAVVENTGLVTSNASAELEISSTVKGFLPPRMTTVQRNLMVAVTGLMIYNTTINQPEYYNGTGWISY